jgi:uracil permease
MILCLAIGIKYSPLAGGAITFAVGALTISLSGLAVAAISGIAMNAILPGKDYEFGTNEQGDTSVNFGARHD